MNITGFTDEAVPGIEEQIEVCRELGWNRIDLRGIDGVNITAVDDATFEEIAGQLESADIEAVSFGSTIANWSRSLETPFEEDLAEIKRAAPRMRRLGTSMIRIMSYRAPAGPVGTNPEAEAEIVRRLSALTRIAEENGILCIHENCETWGGQSWEHTLFLLETIDSPAFRLVFDTGNPFWIDDVRADAAGRQDALEFYRKVRGGVGYIHIKDGRMRGDEAEYTFPGDGDGRIPEILSELHRDDYDAGVSIEPHMAVVYHDPSVTSDASYRKRVFLEYAERTAELCSAAGFVVQRRTDNGDSP